MVNGILGPGDVLDSGQFWSGWRNECPMAGPRRALINPLTNRFDLSAGQVPLGFHRRHVVVVFVRSADAAIQLALRALTGNNDRLAIFEAKGSLPGVEPQLGFAGLFIRAMTRVAIVGEDGLDITVEIQGLAIGRSGAEQPRHGQGDCQAIAISSGHPPSIQRLSVGRKPNVLLAQRCQPYIASSRTSRAIRTSHTTSTTSGTG